MKITKSNGGSVFRKIAMGSWKTAADPSVYGMIEVDMTKALEYLEKLNASQSEVKVGVTEMVGRAIALVLKKRPEMNGMIRWGRIYLRDSVNLFYQVNVPGGEDDPIGKANLLGLTIPHAESKGMVEIARELKKKARSIKAGHENEMTKSVRTLSLVPWQLMRWALNLTSFLNYDLNLPLQKLGMPKDPFGSVMITNVGGMGVDTAWAPLVPYTRVPLLITVGGVKKRPWVVDGKLDVRPVMRLCCTFDHRFMDGVHAAAMQRQIEHFFENPETLA